jgi:hypothetical protein
MQPPGSPNGGLVMPAKAGIQVDPDRIRTQRLDSRFHGNDGRDGWSLASFDECVFVQRMKIGGCSNE